VSGGLILALGAAEAIASHPWWLSRLWSRIDPAGCYPFGAVRLPALLRFCAAVMAVGAALLIVLEMIVKILFHQVADGAPRMRAQLVLLMSLLTMVIGCLESCTTRCIQHSGDARVWRSIATFVLVLTGGTLNDALATCGIVGLLIYRTFVLVKTDGRLLMQSTYGSFESAAYDDCVRRATRLPGVDTIYDACFWELEGKGAAVGALRCILDSNSSGHGSNNVMKTINHVRSIFIGTPAAHDLSIHVEMHTVR